MQWRFNHFTAPNKTETLINCKRKIWSARWTHTDSGFILLHADGRQKKCFRHEHDFSGFNLRCPPGAASRKSTFRVAMSGGNKRENDYCKSRVMCRDSEWFLSLIIESDFHEHLIDTSERGVRGAWQRTKRLRPAEKCMKNVQQNIN